MPPPLLNGKGECKVMVKKRERGKWMGRWFVGILLLLLLLPLSRQETYAEGEAESVESAEETKEEARWQLKTRSYDGGYFLESPYYYGISLATGRRNDKIPYQIKIAQDTLVVSADWHTAAFSNMHAEGNAYTNVCFRTETGVFGVAQMVQGPNSGELYFTGDKLIQGMTVNDFLLQTMERGESFDLFFLLHEWMLQPRDPSAYVYFTVTMEDPEFTTLITQAREADWGMKEPVSGAAFPDSEERNPKWTAWHYANSETGSIQDTIYLTAELECAAVHEDLTGELAMVHAYVDPYVFSFSVDQYADGEWQPITNWGEDFQTWAAIRTGDGKVVDTGVVLTYASSEFRFPADKDKWSGPDDETILGELAKGGCVDVAFGLAFTDGDGNVTNVNYYFSIPAHDGVFQRLYEKAWELDWTEKAASEDGRALTALSSDSKEVNPYEWDWVKTHTEDGILYIRNREAYPGTVTAENGAEEEAYLILLRSYKGMEFAILDKEQKLITNSQTKPISCRLVWNKGYVNEIAKPFKEAKDDGTGLVLLPDMKDGILAINVMKQALMARGSAALEITDGDGRTFLFPLPENDYAKILDLVADDWYIPTFNDQIFDGDGVNPDLVAFMEEFMPKIMAAFEKAKNTQAISKNDELLQMIKKDEELNRLYGSYVFMAEHVLPRGVDSAYFEQTRAELEGEVEKQRFRDYADLLGKVADKALEFSDQVHAYFGDELGTDYDLTFKIAGYIADFVEKQVD